MVQNVVQRVDCMHHGRKSFKTQYGLSQHQQGNEACLNKMHKKFDLSQPGTHPHDHSKCEPIVPTHGHKIHDHSGQLALLANSTASDKTCKLSHMSNKHWQPTNETNQMEFEPNNLPWFGDDYK